MSFPVVTRELLQQLLLRNREHLFWDSGCANYLAFDKMLQNYLLRENFISPEYLASQKKNPIVEVCQKMLPFLKEHKEVQVRGQSKPKRSQPDPRPKPSARIAGKENQNEKTQEQKLLLTHVQQMHKTGRFGEDEMKDPDFQKIARSQFEIARYILEHPDHQIVLESLTEDLPPLSDPRMKTEKKLARDFFPRGIPLNFLDLNDLQKRMLYTKGAVRLLHSLSTPNKVYRSISPQESKRIDDFLRPKLSSVQSYFTMDPETRHHMMTLRDEAAIKEVERAFDEGAKSVDLVFGRTHNFLPYTRTKEWTFETRSL